MNRNKEKKAMMKCDRCGATVFDNQDTCPVCGNLLLTPIDVEARSRHRYKHKIDVLDYILGITLVVPFSYIGFIVACCCFNDRPDVRRGAIHSVIFVSVCYIVALIVVLAVLRPF